MTMFHHYNDVRIGQLKKIEDDFNRHIKGDIAMFSQFITVHFFIRLD